MQRDWILRVIEQLGAVLAQLRRMIFQGEPLDAAASERLDHALGQAGLSPAMARTASADTLLMMVAPTGEIDPTRTWVLAESLYVLGLDAELVDHPERAESYFGKALVLYKLIEPGSAFTGMREASERIADLEHRLSGVAGPDFG